MCLRGDMLKKLTIIAIFLVSCDFTIEQAQNKVINFSNPVEYLDFTNVSVNIEKYIRMDIPGTYDGQLSDYSRLVEINPNTNEIIFNASMLYISEDDGGRRTDLAIMDYPEDPFVRRTSRHLVYGVRIDLNNAHDLNFQGIDSLVLVDRIFHTAANPEYYIPNYKVVYWFIVFAVRFCCSQLTILLNFCYYS